MAKTPHPEKILGVTRGNLERLLSFPGLVQPLTSQLISSASLSLMMLLKASEFRVRDEVEEDPDFKQIIPYVVLSYTVPYQSHQLPLAYPQEMIFTYARGKAGEDRLHAKRSLGIGGHIEASDFMASAKTFATGKKPAYLSDEKELENGYFDSLAREMFEEVELSLPDSSNLRLVSAPICFINDETTPVGQSHLGVVHLVPLVKLKADAKESASLTDTRFVPSNTLYETQNRFENWSQLLIDGFWPSRIRVL